MANRSTDSFALGPTAALWWRSLALPALTFVVAVAIISGLVFGGVIRGDKTYAGPSGAPTTQPTVMIEPRYAKPYGSRRREAVAPD
jgi:hypothetical protein